MTQIDSNDITNKMLLEHMQAIKCGLTQKIERIGKKLDEHDRRFDSMDKRFDAVDKRFDEHDRKFNKIDIALQRLYERRVEMVVRIDRLEEKVGVA